MRFKTLFTSICLAALVSGCAAPKAIDTKSGFLEDYSKLQASKTDENSAVYFAEGYDVKNYKNIVFAPVKVQLAPELTKDSNIGAAQQEEIATYVAKELDRAFSKGFSGQGDGTLKIRSAVSGLSSKSENLGFYQYLPVTLAATAALEAGGQRDKEVYVFLEAEAIDEGTGEVVAAKIAAHQLGLADTGALKEDPKKALEPLLKEWIDKLVAKIQQQLM